MENKEAEVFITKILHLAPTLLVGCMVTVFATGCLGPQVLKERAEHVPAADPRVELCLKAGPAADVLVVYDDVNPGSGKVKRRAFYLFANFERVTHGGRPEFVSPHQAKNLSKIPLFTEEPGKQAQTNDDLYAVFSSPQDFMLMSCNQPVAEFRLPEYGEWLTAKKLFLFPAAVTADAVGVGAVVGAAAAQDPQFVAETVNALAHKH
ncbi:MAG: hypothetical protein JWQ04_2852 [Pedosphaera sp.]|nr:hypothetical protein [Pedosphaera sp.]